MDYEGSTGRLSGFKDMKSTSRLGDQNSKTYKRSTETALKKQRIAIEKVKKDKEILKEQLATQTRNMNISQTVSLTNKMNKLNEINDALQQKIKLERMKIQQMEEKIAKYDERIKACRKEMEDFGGINISKESHSSIEKQIKVLENRLDKALVKFNDSLAMNKKLRDTIENLRQERVVFDNIYKKMEKELHEKKRAMARIIEASNSAYEEGDEAQKELVALRSQHQSKMQRFEAEFEELEKMLVQNDMLNEKLNLTKKDNRDELLGNSLMLENERNPKTSNDKAKLNATINMVKQYEEMLNKIEQATGHNIESLVKEFSSAEDSNFSLFTYVNELNSEIEKLEEQNSELEEELNKYKSDGPASYSEKMRVISDLQENLRIEREKAESFDLKFTDAMETVQALTGGISEVFNLIGCDSQAVTEMLGTAGVTESNMMIYLGMIEQRTNLLLKVWENEATPQDAATVAESSELGPKHAFGSTSIVINAPSTGEEDDSDDDIDDERPLTREELMGKISQKKIKL